MIAALVGPSRGAVLVAPPGAGKTTRLPLRLVEEPAPCGRGEVLVVEPRRLAARLAAEHVAETLGEPVGRTVGYAVRFDTRRSAETRLTYLTGGVLLRRLREDPELTGVAAVLFDEFHERHAVDDALLAWISRLRATGGGPRIAVMSATLAGGSVASRLGLPLVESLGRQYPVEVAYVAHADGRSLALEIRGAVTEALGRPDGGDILVFLPGLRAIDGCARAVADAVSGSKVDVLKLHAGLEPAETRDVLRRRTDGTRRVILSTNVAESSVTLDGVRTVIDSGLHNVARANPWTGLTALVEEAIPRDSADQRAGRAGRQGPGRCVRLYSLHDAQRRPAQLDPELLRSDLAELVLTLAGLSDAVRSGGVGAPEGPAPALPTTAEQSTPTGGGGLPSLPWLDPPPADAWRRALEVLESLGALDASGRITPLGRRLAALPVPPRLGRLATFAAEAGAAEAGAWAAAVLSEDQRLSPGEPDGDSDVTRLVRLARRRGDRRVAEVAKSLSRVLAAPSAGSGRAGQAQATSRGAGRELDPEGDAAHTVVREALLHAFPDRVARRRENDPKRFMLAGGGDMTLADASTVRHGDFIVAVDGAGGARPTVRLASAIEPDWIFGLPDAERLVTETVDVRWNDRTERVEASESTRYRGLTLQRRALDPRDQHEAGACLREAVRRTGLGRFTDAEALEKLMQRRRIAAQSGELPPFGQAELDALLDQLCQGLVSFKEVKEADLLEAVTATLSYKERARFETLAPERIVLPSGRTARVKYVEDGPPRVSAQVQHLFGLTDTPAVAGGRVKCLVELLAPNQRPVQLTDDLAGFWTRTWAEVRKELRGRYPRHAWPEDPRRVQRDDDNPR